MLEPWSLSVRRARKSLVLKLYQRRILARAAAIHATSNMEADNIRRLNFGDVPVLVVPNAVAEPLPATGASAAPGGKRVLLFLSRIHEKKGVDLLLQAWNECRPADWRLLIVGGGEEQYLARLRHYCSVNDVPDVEFHPHAEGDERERIFREASAFVLPTYSENFGNVVAEALIRGLPVITTTGTPWSEIVARRCGWYIRPMVDELKQVIAEVTHTDPNLLRQMGARGREYVRANFTLPVVRQALLSMYRTAIHGRA
jgi:glycosyltransferase involved in cell wall biosynthesis